MNGKMMLFLVVCIMLVGGIAGWFSLFTGSQDGWSPRDYTVREGECWVRPQGDPLYDEHYAKNVNTPNCDAFKTQEQGKQIEAVTRNIEWSTTNGMIGVYSILGVVVVGLFVIVALIIRGPNAEV